MGRLDGIPCHCRKTDYRVAALPMRSIVHKVHRFGVLPTLRRNRFLAALWSLTFATVLLRSIGYQRSRALLTRRFHGPRRDLKISDAAERVEVDAWAVRAADEQLPWGSCLPRSLTLWWLLSRRGIDTEIHFGVRKSEDDLAAHAWVVWGDQALTDSVDPRAHYTLLKGG